MTSPPANHPDGWPFRRWWLSLTAVVCALVPILAVGIGWGMPEVGGSSWSFDEIRPDQVTSGDWPEGKPALQLFVLRWFYQVVGEDDPTRLAAGRLLSLLAGLAAVVLIALAARPIAGPLGGLIAAVLLGTLPAVVFYSKLGNLDAPMLFWTVLAVLGYVRFVRDGGTGSLLLLSIGAAAATATKLYPAALFVPAPLVFWYADRRWPLEGRRRAGWRLLGGCALGVVLLLTFSGWFWQPQLLRDLVAHRLSGGRLPLFREFSADLGGQLGLLGATLRDASWLLGLPLTLAVVAGLVFLCRERHRPWALALLLPLMSFYLFIIAPLGFEFVRFLLAPAPLAILAASWALASLVAKRKLLGWVLVLVTCGSGLTRAVAVDRLLVTDSRLRAEAWLAAQRADVVPAVAVGRQQMLPRGLRVIPWQRLSRSPCAVLASEGADLLTVASDDGWLPEERVTRARLLGGHLGYRELRRFPPPPWKALLFWSEPSTNLSKASPEIVVLERSDQPCRNRRWVMEEAAELLAEPDSARLRELAGFVAEFWFEGRRTLVPDRAFASGLDPQGRTYGAAPTTLVLVNPDTQPWLPRVEVRGYAGSEQEPQRFTVVIDGRLSTDSLSDLGWRSLDVGAVPPGQRVLVLLATDRATSFGQSSGKRYGLRIRVLN